MLLGHAQRTAASAAPGFALPSGQKAVLSIPNARAAFTSGRIKTHKADKRFHMLFMPGDFNDSIGYPELVV
ncbi:hypothetical protein KR94_20135 [Pantoea ananatis]|nr:hypothetical protein KR94_20135 [Pantoea ananatis]